MYVIKSKLLFHKNVANRLSAADNRKWRSTKLISKHLSADKQDFHELFTA